MNLDLYKYIYLIGVGGIGMSGLARYFHAKGKKVYGYDAVRSDLCKNLEKEGVSIHYDEHVKSISSVIIEANYSETLIIYTPAICESNSIFQFFKEKGYPLFKRAEILGFISKNSYTIAVAGTHGKTTTSSMLAHILRDSGFSCTAFLGGISTNYNTNLILSDQENILIVEADEYDRSFLYLNPDIAIITSLDSDHLDIYSDYQQLVLAFKQFASQVKNKGLLLVENKQGKEVTIKKETQRIQN